jgi:ABC-type phosphate transport system substrate-binding protein
MKQMNGNAQIVDAVKADENGIGYVGVGYIFDEKGNIQKGIKVLEVSLDDGPAYSPTNRDDVKSGRYPITRPLLQIIKGKPRGAAKDFVTFELSPEGQKIVEEQGFSPSERSISKPISKPDSKRSTRSRQGASFFLLQTNLVKKSWTWSNGCCPSVPS